MRPPLRRLLPFLGLILLGACHPPPRSPQLPAELEVAPPGPSRAERRALAAGLRQTLSRQRQILLDQAAHLARAVRSTQRWLALPIEVDAAVLSSPDPAREISIRFLERAFAHSGFLLLQPQAVSLLGRWKTHPRGAQLRVEIAEAQRRGRPLLYRGDVVSALGDYSDMLRQHARALEDALERLASERYAEEGIQSFYIAHYNALVLILQGLGDLPVAPLNLLRTLEGREHIPGLGQWLARCQERLAADSRPREGDSERSWRAPCVLRTLPYVGAYGRKYGSSLETGALLGMMTPAAGAVLQGALAKTLGPGTRWLSAQAGEAGAQLVRMLGFWLRKGGQAFAIEAAIDVGRGLGILWRGGEELPDGRFEPLGAEEAVSLLQEILVHVAVAKNVRELVGSEARQPVVDGHEAEGHQKAPSGREPIEPGAGGHGVASEFGDLSRMTRAEADVFLRSLGATVKTTRGGYTEYKFLDGSKVWIRPSGEVVRIPAPRYAEDGRRSNKGGRLDQLGKPTESHNTGERLTEDPVRPSTGQDEARSDGQKDE